MTNKGDAKVSAYKQASLRHRQEFHDHLDLTLRLQADLKSDADQLKAQEGWDVATCKGIDVWTDDLATVFRFLKRNDWKAEKTYPILLDALSMRATKSLHLPIPKILPYSQSDLFYMLPLPQHTDKLGRPICVLTCRHILRNERGLDDLIQWVWWSCELLRRTLSDYWTARRWGGIQGVGSEGCVVIVDAGGAGYRNLEVELLPNLVKVSSKNFPGLIQNVFVFNAGWTQRSLWKIVKPILPSTAIQRIKFIEASSGYEEYFEKNALPKVFGGTNGYTFHPDNNPLLNYYSSHSLTGPESGGTETKLPTRNASFASTAEIFHTASNTPITSRRGSVSVSQNDHHALRMTKSFHVLPTTGINSRANAPHIVDHTPSVTSPVSSASQEVEVISTVQDLTIHAQLDIPTASTEKGMSPLQRIRSMADFKLYLSPSRLAQVDLLNSDSEDDHPMDTRARRRSSVRTIQPILQRRRTLRPVAFEPGRFLVPNGVTERRSRPPLRLLGIPNHLTQVEENRRSYSDLLIRHHAEELQKLDQIPAEVLRQHAVDDHVDLSQPDLIKPTSPPTTPYPISAGNHIGNIVPISAFSRSANPFYGYPAIRLPSPGHPDHASIQPRYARRRKRDLVKTLLFLFLLRLQSLRDGIERTLGLNRLLPWTGGASSHQRYRKALDPSEGLMRTYEGENGKKVKRTIGSDWFWAVMTLALVRGGWIGFLAWPLELLGLQGLKGMLRV